MCGSGTLLTEAALIASRTPPQYWRTYFCCKRWLDFDADLWDRVVAEANALKTVPPKSILGADISGRALQAAKENSQAIGFQKHIRLGKADFFTRKSPDTEGGLMLVNPPYDERLKLENAIEFHKKIGDALKQNWKGWTVWLLSGNLEAAKFIGLRPTRRVHLFNGALECRFLKYTMY
jgi:putative N6-adenine-specific DNA methylase